MRLWAALLSGCIVGVVGLGAYAGWNLWDLAQLGNVAAINRAVDVFDPSGHLIAQRSANGEFRIYTPLSQMRVYGPAARWRQRIATSTGTPRSMHPP